VIRTAAQINCAPVGFLAGNMLPKRGRLWLADQDSWRHAHADLADCVHHIPALRDQSIDPPQLAVTNFLWRMRPCGSIQSRVTGYPLAACDDRGGFTRTYLKIG